MFGLIYLVVTVMFGISTVYWMIDVEDIYKKIAGEDFSQQVPKSLLLIPAGAIFGIASTTFFNYFSIYLLNELLKNIEKAYFWGTTFTTCLLILLIIVNVFVIRKKKLIQNLKPQTISKKRFFMIVSAILLAVSCFLMIDSFRSNDTEYILGGCAWGDLAYHTAMTSSFGIAGNIPTTYMHYSTQGIRWHFLFYFLCGILNYLGMPLTYAINIPSIIFLFLALNLLGLLAILFCRSRYAFFIAPSLVLFRSSFNVFFEIKRYLQEGIPVLEGIMKESDWSSVMPYDSWGIYTLNVVVNQRHFMFGASVIILFVLLFLPYLKEALESYKGKEALHQMFFSKEAWEIDWKDKRLVVALILVSVIPYFHGSALITLLLILFGFAIFSKHRLSFLIVAIFATCSSLLQTKFFSGGVGNVFRPMIHFGFVIEEHSLMGYLRYIFATTGIMSLLLLLNFFVRNDNRMLYASVLMSFLLPYIFAFVVQTSWGIHDNHKYVLFSIMLLDVLITSFLIYLLQNIKPRAFKVILVMSVTFLLTITGVTEFITFVNRNRFHVYLEKESELVQWIKTNTEKTDVFFTPNWLCHHFYLAGRGSFLGWPIIAYEVGYDADERVEMYEYLLKGCNENVNEFIRICKENNVKYFVDSQELLNTVDESTEMPIYNQQFIEEHFELMTTIPKEGLRIYKIY